MSPDVLPLTVSVVIAARNAEDYIDTAIAQVEAQSLDAFEVVVVDDASEDGTGERLASWARDDPRVTVLRNDQRLGVAGSRNKAVAQAKGEFVWFTDCDDHWSSEILQRLTDRALETDADVVICGATRVRADGQVEGPIAGAAGAPVQGPADALGRLMRGEIEGHLWNKLFRRTLFDTVQFPPNYAFSDLGAMGPLLVRAKSIALLNEPLYTYVLRPGSILNGREARPRDLLDCRQMLWEAVSQLPPSPELANDQLRFQYEAVYLPTLHGIVRRGARDADSRAVRHQIRSEIKMSDAVRLARLGQWRIACAAVGLKYAFHPYSVAYKVFRLVKWGSVGYGSR